MSQDRSADVVRLRRTLAANPQDRVSWHNLAAAEGDLGHAAQAEEAARRAIALGIPAPETRLVLARALQDLNRLDEAERMFEEALARRPAYAEAHRDLAQLRWMRAGRRDAALAALDEALRRAPQEAHLHLVRAVALEFMEDPAAALASAQAGLERAPHDLPLLQEAAHLSAQLGDSAAALAHARRALGLAPGLVPVQITLCEALLACGDAVQAESVAGRLCAAAPLDQHALALRATAWRLLGDERYATLYDYGRLVSTHTIAAPRGWSTLDEFLGDLRAELESLHRYSAHPFQQSVRGGGQLPLNAAELARPAIGGLFEQFQDAVNRHLARIGTGQDAFSARNTRRFDITGAWSVRLASGGYHTDHVHQRGWLSSAFYVAVPPNVMRDESGRAGWLRLGKPGFRTQPTLAAEHYVPPQPGRLVLFPSYIWHGVEPFESNEVRVTVAFDALPDA
jgi:uncharacterized protein (TIGR02466 family)